MSVIVTEQIVNKIEEETQTKTLSEQKKYTYNWRNKNRARYNEMCLQSTKRYYLQNRDKIIAKSVERARIKRQQVREELAELRILKEIIKINKNEIMIIS